MNYAPVVIPTLNRHEHFRQCLESLERCTGADHTDVYVALDYPPSEKYVEGWKVNDAYLHEKEKNHRFKSLTVYRRETNYFFSGKGNSSTAIKDLPEGTDRYILSEDDNVFSPNFLEFINKGLEKFKDDPSILAICGYAHPYKIKYKDNNYFMQNVDFSAWGYGVWMQKKKNIKVYDKTYLKRRMRSWKTWIRLKRNGLNRLLNAIFSTYGHHPVPQTDNSLSVYMAMENMNVVMPVVSKVRNMGWDDSGLHCHFDVTLSKIHNEMIIDEDTSFDYVGDGMNFYDENKKIFVESSYAKCSYWSFIVRLTKCIIKLKG